MEIQLPLKSIAFLLIGIVIAYFNWPVIISHPWTTVIILMIGMLVVMIVMFECMYKITMVAERVVEVDQEPPTT